MSWPVLNSKLLYKIGQDFLDLQYSHSLSYNIIIEINTKNVVKEPSIQPSVKYYFVNISNQKILVQLIYWNFLR